MKIGLLTFHETTNFGSYLQTYSLYRVLCNMGYDCEVIDYKCDAIIKRELPAKRPTSLSPKAIARYILVDGKYKKKYDKFQSILKKTIALSRPYNRDNIGTCVGMYDAIVVGSDLLWDLNITEKDFSYFLDFCNDNSKKYSFATSMGAPFADDLKDMVYPLLKSFSRIAVRESESAKWMTKELSKSVESVCDPTMLLERDEWDNFIDQRIKKAKEKYVLVYFNNNEKIISDAKKFAKDNGYKVYVINYGVPIRGVKNIHPYKVAEFLELIKRAEAVFTASYHGMLFSLYYEREVYCYLRNNGNDVRLLNVVEKLGIEDICRKPNTMFKRYKIDYSIVRKKMEAWRKESLDILSSYWE